VLIGMQIDLVAPGFGDQRVRRAHQLALLLGIGEQEHVNACGAPCFEIALEALDMSLAVTSQKLDLCAIDAAVIADVAATVARASRQDLEDARGRRVVPEPGPERGEREAQRGCATSGQSLAPTAPEAKCEAAWLLRQVSRKGPGREQGHERTEAIAR